MLSESRAVGEAFIDFVQKKKKKKKTNSKVEHFKLMPYKKYK